jgi:UDP-N-acetylmuramoyl-L-alanyl-D-glutamate--2,6-diaminopimelate ligase
MIKSLLKRVIPKKLLDFYHFGMAHLAASFYRYPSTDLFVVGVTGTNGKSSTIQYLGRLLEHAGYKVGWTSTASFKVGEKEWVNDKKMTMLGRFATHKLLRRMVKAKCDIALVETSSQGILQHRHIGIHYDMSVFTNLTPEHIEAHGGFENYKAAKRILFECVEQAEQKYLKGKEVRRGIVVNIDDEHAQDFLEYSVDKKFGFGVKFEKPEPVFAAATPVVAKHVDLSAKGTQFDVSGHTFSLKPIGMFNLYNVMASIAACRALGVEWEKLQSGVKALQSVPGRLEVIDEGQPYSVIVDYAYEPAALSALYATLELIDYKRILHVTGSAGGGRDKARRRKIGRLAAEHDDIVIVTNEDPYDENPRQIIDMVAAGAREGGKKENKDLYLIEDRRKAINHAISLAKEGDLVIITGKGSEPIMAVAKGKKVPWDDRKVARECIKKRYERKK